MTDTRAIAALLEADRLGEAVTEAVAALRIRPQDTNARLLLIDLLVLSQDYARADGQAEIASRLQPADAVALARLRGLIRGMEARRAWAAEAAVPAFPGGPTVCDEIALRLGLAHRGGDAEDVAAHLRDLEAARGIRPATVDGVPVDDLRDLDDRLPHALEAVTDGGAYLWIDLSKIERLELATPVRPRDLAWRRAELTLRDGSAAEVLVPLIYAAPASTDAEKLGRVTDWVEEPGGLVTGRGQRCLLVGDEVRALGELTTIAFAGAADG